MGAPICCKLAISLGLCLKSSSLGPGHLWWSGGQRIGGAGKNLEQRVEVSRNLSGEQKDPWMQDLFNKDLNTMIGLR